MDIKVYVATQRKLDFILDSCYEPIFVGAELNKDKDSYGYVTDNTEDNISDKNRSYCELTALYWMWKNSKSDVVGLAHYRRFLSLYRFSTNAENAIGKQKIKEVLKTYDMIVPKKVCLWGTVKEQYASGQYLKDYELCRDIIANKYPEYIEDFDFVSNSDEISICNMFIARKEIIDKYCEWLFSILFEAERKIDISSYSVSEKRIFGYLSERLFNIWIRHNKINVCEMYLLNTGTKVIDRIKRMVHTFNYKVLKINVMKHVVKRKNKREKRSSGD